MIPSIDLKTVRFDEPQYLWLLIVPAVLLVVVVLAGREAARATRASSRIAA